MGRGAALRRTACGLAVVALLAAGVAQGETGDLSAFECLSGDTATGPSGTDACAQSPGAAAAGINSGLDTPQSIDVSGAGTSLYATSQSDDSIVHLTRNPSTGAISFTGCITGETEAGPVAGGGSGACSASAVTAVLGTNTGLDGLDDAVVSPDGISVYATSQNDDAVVRFNRNITTGELTFAGCLSGETESTTGGGGPCVATPTVQSNGSNSGLDSPTGIAISPTGNSVYITTSSDDSIVGFARNPANGALAYGGCISGETASGSTGTAACTDSPEQSTGGSASGLDQLFIPVVSVDGESVYAGSNGDNAVVWFDRNPANGALTFNDCITGETGAGPTGTGACQAASTATANATCRGTAGSRPSRSHRTTTPSTRARSSTRPSSTSAAIR